MKCHSCKFYNSEKSNIYPTLCRFPISQDGSNDPVIVLAAMPNITGENCIQYVKNLTLVE